MRIPEQVRSCRHRPAPRKLRDFLVSRDSEGSAAVNAAVSPAAMGKKQEEEPEHGEWAEPAVSPRARGPEEVMTTSGERMRNWTEPI